MGFKRIMKRLQSSWGRAPDVEYFAGDMKWIRSYYDACCERKKDAFYVDDLTWNDLDMDNVFRRINRGMSTAGEQYLYYMLRRPMNREQLSQHSELTSIMAEDAETRGKLMRILVRIGCCRRVDAAGFLHGEKKVSGWLVLYVVLAMLFPAAIVLVALQGMAGVWLLLGCLVVNGVTHEFRRSHCEGDIRTVNYCVALVWALRKIRKLDHAGLDRHLRESYDSLDRLRTVMRIGSVTSASQNDLVSMVMTFLLLDLITFEVLKKRLVRQREDLLVIHETVGALDAAMAVASFRESMVVWTQPEIDFGAREAFLHAEGAVHPLLKTPTPNDVLLTRPMLITGANATGKSTYLRMAMLCALLAQTVGTAPCRSYRGSPFRIYTAINVSDHLLRGESSYMAEISALKRILDVPEGNVPVLCAIDEVLRGTNTIERIAASAELLRAMAHKGILCLAATHDLELCALTEDVYDQAHFQEEIAGQEIVFDYRIRPGKTQTRNAINLLRLMGFDTLVVDAAHRRADAYVRTGRWQREQDEIIKE